jgi:hypothetical protein
MATARTETSGLPPQPEQRAGAPHDAAADGARRVAEEATRLQHAAAKTFRRGLRDGAKALARELRRTQTLADDRERLLTTFSDLAWAHWRWERQRSEDRVDPHVRREYERRVIAFQERYGEILDAYWSIRDASAVALTERTRRTLLHPFRGERIPRFHRATEWATRDEPAIASALDHCDTLAVKSSEVLRGSSELIALRRVLAVASHLLGFVDRTRGRPPRRGNAAAAIATGKTRHEHDAAKVVKEQKRELAKIEAFYDRAGNKQARIVYFVGMVAGLACLLPFATAVAALIWAVDGLDGERGADHWLEIQTLLVSIAAGALGALLSVLIRMASDTGKFDLDYEVGRKQVRWLGSYRPWLGAIFGVATYLLLASGILQTNPPERAVKAAYYGALAFLAGFFERFLKIAPGGVPTPLEVEAQAGAARAPDKGEAAGPSGPGAAA